MASLRTKRGGVIAALIVLGGVVAMGFFVDAALAAPSPAAPTITASSEPSNPTTSTSAAFAFTDTSSPVTFKCALDTASFTTCTSGMSHTGLALGSHTFQVEAVSGSSTSSATSYTWTIIPATPVITPSSEPVSGTTSTSATFAFTDATGGVTYACSLNASAYAACTSGVTTFTITNGGSNTFSVEAKSGSTTSAPATYAWTVTTPTPTITVSSEPASPTKSTTAAFVYTDTQAGATFKCSLNGAAYAACTSGSTYSGLAQGTNTFAVEAQLGSGPASTPTPTFSWVVDTTPPTISLTFPTNNAAYNAAAWTAGCSPAGFCGTAADTTGSTVASVAVGILNVGTGKYWNVSGFTSSTLVFNPATGTTAWHYAFTPPSDGVYTVYVQATDALGNTTTTANLTTVSFTYDTTPPAAPVIVGGGPTLEPNATNPEFTFTDTSWPNVTFRCGEFSTPPVPSTTLGNNCTGDTDNDGDPQVEGEWQFTNIAPGPQCFYVWAVDEANNIGAVTTYCWTVIGPPAAIAETSGSPQTTPVHSAFGAPLAAKVTDSAGDLVSGIKVTFSAPTSGASGAFASCSGGNPTSTQCVVTTNASGIATSSTITANTVAGGPYAVAATVSGVSTPANFSLTNTTGTASTITVSSGSGQSATVHSAFANPLVAKVTDQYANPVAGVTVTFTPPGTGASGTFTGVNTAVTNASGLATSPVFTANTTPGTYNIAASAIGTSSVNFSETNTVGAAATITVVSGTPQTATVHSAFAHPLIAVVTDAYGNSVAGVPVTFSAPTSGPSGTFASPCSGTTCVVTTNGAGQVNSPSFNANTVAGGPYPVTAAVTGVSTPATFTLTNTAGAATTIAVSSGSGQSATVATAFAKPLVALVTDTYGNPVSGVTVAFAAPASGASETFTGSVNTALTNASGLATSATFTANTTAGTYNVSASATGTGSVSFSETNTAAAAHTIAVSSGSGQSATVNTAFGSPLVAKVTDTYGNPVSGVTVTFAPPGSGASGSFAGSVNTAVTTSSGLATSATFSANTVAGSYSVTANTTPVLATPAIFSETNTAKTTGDTLTIVQGNNQSAPVTTAFPTALEVYDADQYGNPVSGVTVTFTAPASGASGTFANAPPTTTPVTNATTTTTAVTNASGDATASTFTANATAGSYTVTAAAPGVATKASFSLTNTSTSVPTHLVFTTVPSGNQTASATATIGGYQVQEQTSTGTPVIAASTVIVNLTTTSLGTSGHAPFFSLTSGGASGTAATSVTIASGQSTTANFYYSDTRAGTPTLTASATAIPNNATTSPTIVAATAASLAVTAFPTSTTAGAAHAFTVTADDAYGNVATGYRGTVHFTSTDGQATSGSGLPSDYTFTGTDAGIHTTFSATLKTAGSQSITAADSGNSLNGSETSITVTAANAASLSVTAFPTSTTAGVAHAFTVTADDAYGNVATGYRGTVHFTSTDGQAILSAPYAFTGTDAGIHTTFSATLKTAGTQSIAAIDSGNSLNGSETGITVTAGPAYYVTVVSGDPQDTQINTAFANLVVKVTDQYGNPVPSASVTFTAPGSGASGTFSNSSNTITASTGANGQLSEAFTANGTAGGYSVTANTNPNVATPATFHLINDSQFTISGDIPDSLSKPFYPGVTQSLNLTIKNPYNFSIDVTGLTIVVSPNTTIASGPGAGNDNTANCSGTTNMVQTRPFSGSVDIPASTTETLTAAGALGSQLPELQMPDLPTTNQDGCQNTTFHFTYSGSATTP